MALQNYTNALIHAQSPYLLQHAHNPVNWVEWSLEALNTAHQENKLLVISIGYAACHWCHVMERESFEDPLVAKIMNHHFVCIKIDREERPDLDMVYMQALQLLSGKGGWPLNIVALPNGNAIWGGTYFPKNNWLNALKQLIELHTQKPEKILQYASHLKEGMVEIENSKDLAASPISPKDIPNLLDKVYNELDPEWGGKIGAPKFMMPSLLRLCNHRTQQLQKHLHLSLEKMALGGLFDVVKGGFARYSVDHRWHVPHFEKMAYDNGLLLEIYSLALLESQNTLYLEVIDKTICFLQSDLKSPQGGYYASLDADSTNEQEELQEGAFYTWTKKQIKALIPKEEYSLFKAYYGINHHGAWEKDTYVLFRVYSPHEFSKQHKLSYTEFVQTVNRWETTLKNTREKRPKPRLDDKQICSWNALIASGLLAAYRTTQKTTYLIEAQECLMFVQNHFHSTAGLLYRLHKNKTKRVNGFLEDYAATIKCWIDAYETLFLEQYLELAKDLLTYCLAHFTSPDSPLFYFSK